MRSIVWYRGKDLRVDDHAPLMEAAQSGDVIPLFVLDPYFFARDDWPHRRQFLLQSLRELQTRIAGLGSQLLIAQGKSVEVIPRLRKHFKADRVLAYRWTEPFGRERDRRIEGLELWEGETLHVPGSLRTLQGNPFSVFTPFSRAFAKQVHIDKPRPAPKVLPKIPVAFQSVPIPTWPENPNIIGGGERHARARLKRFKHYERDVLAAETSRLSADLKFGTLSARTVWHAIDDPGFRRQLIWREFSHALLWDRPELLHAPFRDKWARFPWRKDRKAFTAWTQGKTGYPVVDAAARQLLEEGFVHNRARMVAASFLTKHLLLDYKLGEAHYMHWLVDGDWAQNNMGWQWSAGCGCDAQPWFRVFNPVTQGEKFDPQGDYVRRWIPELADVPDKYVHAPWTAPSPPKGYPAPVVDHVAARNRFLLTAKAALGG